MKENRKLNNYGKFWVFCTLMYKEARRLISKYRIVGVQVLHLLPIERIELVLAYNVSKKRRSTTSSWKIAPVLVDGFLVDAVKERTTIIWNLCLEKLLQTYSYLTKNICPAVSKRYGMDFWYILYGIFLCSKCNRRNM